MSMPFTSLVSELRRTRNLVHAALIALSSCDLMLFADLLDEASLLLLFYFVVVYAGCIIGFAANCFDYYDWLYSRGHRFALAILTLIVILKCILVGACPADVVMLLLGFYFLAVRGSPFIIDYLQILAVCTCAAALIMAVLTFTAVSAEYLLKRLCSRVLVIAAGLLLGASINLVLALAYVSAAQLIAVAGLLLICFVSGKVWLKDLDKQ